MNSGSASRSTLQAGPWLLSAILALLVVVALAAAVGSAGWIARSGDEARENEDRGMLMMAFAEHRSLLADAAGRAAESIAGLGPDTIGPVSGRIERLLAPQRFHQIHYGLAYLLRDGSEIVAAYPSGSVSHGSKVEPRLAKLVAALETASPAVPPPLTMGHAAQHWLQPEHGAASDMGHSKRFAGADRRTSFLRLDESIYVMAVATVGDSEVAPGSGALTGMTVVLLSRIDPGLIGRMAVQHRVSDLRADVRPPEPGRAALALGDATDGLVGYLSWTPATPVSNAFREATPFFAALALALCTLAGLAGAQSLRSTRRLAVQERQARHEADHDVLTGLLNRASFVTAIKVRLADRAEEATSIVYLDLDGFKEINDTLGHQAGDALLVTVGQRIRDAVGRHGILARLGGDEFAALLPRTSPQRAVELGEEISRAIREPIAIGDKSLSINVSAGLACAPMHGRESQELLRRADIALYAAKKSGRGQVSLFHDAMEDSIRRRQLVDLDLRAALGTDQLYLAYQVIVGSDGTRPLGVEALLRWDHPERGAIPPSEFIPVLEETGFIRTLGVWVLQQACRAVKNWPGLTVAVNVSPVQMRSRDIVETVARVLAEAELEPSRLVLEITEGVLIEQQDEASTIVRALQALGVSIALDDFGAGYSSLAYLKRFPFDKLKIDKSFVGTLGQRANDATIVHSIISLGRALGMAVIAEGVETREQHRFLRAAGCHEFQGYLFARPVRANEIDELLGVAPQQDQPPREFLASTVADGRQVVANVA
jgi:diguanylate cyclase